MILDDLDARGRGVTGDMSPVWSPQKKRAYLTSPPVHLIKKRFGYWVVLELEHERRVGHRPRYWAHCVCACGTRRAVLVGSLTRGASTSCGCSKQRCLKTTGSNSHQFRGFGEISMRFWRGCEHGASERGHSFALSIEYAWQLFLTQQRRCALSGIHLVFQPGKNVRTTASLDRIEPKIGYEPGNVQWVHKRINIMRNTLSVQEFIEFCRKVVAHADVSNG